MYKVGIITASDSGSEGKREDLSGQLIREMVEKAGYLVVDYKMVADDLEMIKETIIYMSDGIGVDLVLTTGGTGFSKRDNTPEATLAAVQRRVPGIPEAMRYLSLQSTPKAMLSRSEAGIRNDTLIINLPGSPKAVRECLEYIMVPMEHGLEILKGDATNCAEEDKSSKK